MESSYRPRWGDSESLPPHGCQSLQQLLWVAIGVSTVSTTCYQYLQGKRTMFTLPRNMGLVSIDLPGQSPFSHSRPAHMTVLALHIVQLCHAGNQ